MAVDYGKKNTASQKAADVKARLGKSMDNKRPGYKPPPSSKLKVSKNGAKIVAKF
jgi:hypothetical protein